MTPYDISILCTLPYMKLIESVVDKTIKRNCDFKLIANPCFELLLIVVIVMAIKSGIHMISFSLILQPILIETYKEKSLNAKKLQRSCVFQSV